MLLEGKKVFVGPFLKRAERPADKEMHYTNIFIKNLAESVTEDQLQKLFAEHGMARARASACCIPAIAIIPVLASLHAPSHPFCWLEAVRLTRCRLFASKSERFDRALHNPIQTRFISPVLVARMRRLIGAEWAPPRAAGDERGGDARRGGHVQGLRLRQF